VITKDGVNEGCVWIDVVDGRESVEAAFWRCGGNGHWVVALSLLVASKPNA